MRGEDLIGTSLDGHKDDRAQLGMVQPDKAARLFIKKNPFSLELYAKISKNAHFPIKCLTGQTFLIYFMTFPIYAGLFNKLRS